MESILRKIFLLKAPGMENFLQVNSSRVMSFSGQEPSFKRSRVVLPNNAFHGSVVQSAHER